jgi:hypothetical protein
MHLVHEESTYVQTERSPLAAARIHRKLTTDEVARRADLPVDQVEWLEEGRVYRFPSTDHALLATLLYATALGIDVREARTLAGLPVGPRERSTRGRFVAAAAALAVLGLLAFAVFPGVRGGGGTKSHGRPLPAPWKVSVDVLNGGGDINYTRSIASRVGGFGYRVAHVARANRFDYTETAVYYEPGGASVCGHLADELHVALRPLPGGTNPDRCVVIAGPPRVP